MQNALLRWRPNPLVVIPAYGYQLIRFLYCSGVFASVATQTTSIAHLGLSRFAGLVVAIPPLEEQARLVKVLASVDKSRRASERELEQLRRTKTGLLQDLLTGKVRVTP